MVSHGVSVRARVAQSERQSERIVLGFIVAPFYVVAGCVLHWVKRRSVGHERGKTALAIMICETGSDTDLL